MRSTQGQFCLFILTERFFITLIKRSEQCSLIVFNLSFIAEISLSPAPWSEAFAVHIDFATIKDTFLFIMIAARVYTRPAILMFELFPKPKKYKVTKIKHSAIADSR